MIATGVDDSGGCHGGVGLETDFEPIIIEEKKIVEKTVRLRSVSGLFMADSKDIKMETGSISFESNALIKQEMVTTCIALRLVTPSEGPIFVNFSLAKYKLPKTGEQIEIDSPFEGKPVTLLSTWSTIFND